MRDITFEKIAQTIEELCIKSATVLTPDLAILLECAMESETNEAGKSAMCDIVDNFKLAAESGLPICQDTGMAVVFAEVGQEVHIVGGAFADAVDEGVRRGYDKGALRKSVVKDPFIRENTGDNTPAVLHTSIVPGDTIKFTVAPKGFGSENMSAMKMLLPSDDPSRLEEVVEETIRAAGARACPPMVIGIGLGGTIEQAALLAKKALTRPVDVRNGSEFYAKLETRILRRINRMGIGPQGFGGINTAVAVNIETYPTHITALPCVINVGCHVTRHASAEI